MDIESEVRRAAGIIGSAKSNLLRPTDCSQVLNRALELKSIIGHLEALTCVLSEFKITERSPKEIEAYRSFVNAALTPPVKTRTRVGMRVTREMRDRYDAEKPDPSRFQEELAKKYP